MGQQDRFSRESYAWGWENRMQPVEGSTHQQFVPREGRPLPIHQALREYAGIDATDFFVAAFRPEGVVTFSSPGTLSQEQIDRFFLPKEYQKCRSSSTSVSLNDEPRIPFRRPGQGIEAFDDYSPQKPARKRLRQTSNRLDGKLGEEDIPTAVVTKKRSIEVGNAAQLQEFYELRFRNCQQSACKLIAKAWIKAVEPKKQSTHPYTGKDEKAPGWWPEPWGELRDQKVRHKEPDHLYKKERVHLLCHILRLVMQPNEYQHRDIRKLQLNIAKLEEVTNEALSSWFADSTNPGNRQKKPYLKEIFKVAHQEERFLAGGIDAKTKIHVMSDERVAEGYASDNEDSSPSRIDEDQERKTSSRSMTPSRGSIQNMVPYGNVHGPLDHPDNHMQGSSYVGDMVMRGQHFSQPVMGSDIHTGQHSYSDVGNMPVAAPLNSAGSMPLSEIYTSTHDTGRRPSIPNSHSDFNTPTTPGVYSPWTSGASAPNNTSIYSVPGQHSSAHNSYGQANAPMAQTQSWFDYGDGIPRGHDLGHPNVLRGVGPGTMPHQSGYSDYMHQSGRPGQGPDMKQEAQVLARNILQ
ncbi:uncharacterized protein JN550_000060 [Neoarthrinium moseri]|uniref:uncharacterized protein n=1 Tax=Neoarthrinium moseri TaxID=1658444 RepID=UPI001FDC7409|nr:uncharacterized protein JN550_000060 [Neoarthrinium moseri]KAI1877878.1 hypothetical protein JN550_000060 [Neoarthrinium moseri]